MQRIFEDLLPSLTEGQQMAVLIGAGVVLVALLALVVALVVRRRRRRPRPLDDELPASDIIRRPVYVDPLLLDDLLGHAETRDYGTGLRDALEVGDPDRRPAEVRKLNKVLVGLRERSDLLLDLDHAPDAELESGKAIQITGTLTRLPASDAADLLELSAPLLIHAANGHGRDQRRDGPAVSPAPLVLRLSPSTGGDRSYLVVLDHDGLWNGDRHLPPGPVTVLGIVEEAIGSRDRLDIAELLPERLSYPVRESIGDRDAGEVAATLSTLTATPLKRKELHFDGPGARIGTAAIYR